MVLTRCIISIDDENGNGGHEGHTFLSAARAVPTEEPSAFGAFFRGKSLRLKHHSVNTESRDRLIQVKIVMLSI
jgi:hypothetical protein